MIANDVYEQALTGLLEPDWDVVKVVVRPNLDYDRLEICLQLAPNEPWGREVCLQLPRAYDKNDLIANFDDVLQAVGQSPTPATKALRYINNGWYALAPHCLARLPEEHVLAALRARRPGWTEAEVKRKYLWIYAHSDGLTRRVSPEVYAAFLGTGGPSA